ncbi:MAG: LolA family protein [Alphaproteobacteria bacterium]
MRALMTGFAARAAACFALVALLAALPGTAPAVNNSHLSKRDVQDLRRVSHYLNTLPPLKGRFLQVSEEPSAEGGRTLHAKGTFYLKQPGRMRFEYDPPQQVLFISDGRFVTVEDKEMESVNNYPLSDTPLHLLLKGDLNLVKDARIVAVKRTAGHLQVTARKGGGDDMSGQLTMTFAYPTLELRQWTVVDSRETRTTVTLRKVQKGVRLKPGLFRATDYDFEDWD